MTIVDLVEVLSNNPSVRPWKTRDVAKIKWLTLHHAASMEDTTPAALNALHHKRGWWRVSYHYLVGADGTVYKCNRATDITWTVANGNSGSLSVCLIGNREKTPCPPGQWEALVWLCKHLRDSYPTIQHLYGHRECPTDPPQRTLCPGKFVTMAALRTAVSWREEEV